MIDLPAPILEGKDDTEKLAELCNYVEQLHSSLERMFSNIDISNLNSELAEKINKTSDDINLDTYATIQYVNDKGKDYDSVGTAESKVSSHNSSGSSHGDIRRDISDVKGDISDLNKEIGRVENKCYISDIGTIRSNANDGSEAYDIIKTGDLKKGLTTGDTSWGRTWKDFLTLVGKYYNL